MITTLEYLLAYLVVCIGGWLLVGACLHGIRWWLGIKTTSFAPLDLLIGTTERAVALTLVLKTPPYLPIFIGGGSRSNSPWAGSGN